MNKLRICCFVLIVGFLVSSCLPKEVTGFYYASNGDGLWLKRDGELLWSPLSKTKDDFKHLGMLSYYKNSGKVHLVMASSHPYFGTEVEFSEESMLLKVKWNRFDQTKVNNRATKYSKRD